jgi:hypothetical protein
MAGSIRRGMVAFALACWGAIAFAGSLRYCQSPVESSALEQDRWMQVSAIVKSELERSGAKVALVSRSGLALEWLGHRYSHAGVSLRASLNGPWSVRQLYFACDEQRPRLFDQGMSGFVMGSRDPSLGFLSIVFLPADQSLALENTALDNGQALRWLGDTYSANAHAFSHRYQNCNQWLAELLAAAWGSPSPDAQGRAWAQQWLASQGFEPSVVRLVWPPLLWIAATLPWIHTDDHPETDLANAQFRLSMPASIETFVHRLYPQSTRIELCYSESRVVVRRGWESLASDCVPDETDEVIGLHFATNSS